MARSSADDDSSDDEEAPAEFDDHNGVSLSLDDVEAILTGEAGHDATAKGGGKRVKGRQGEAEKREIMQTRGKSTDPQKREGERQTEREREGEGEEERERERER